MRLCSRSNETCAPIAKLPNSAQLEGTPIIPPNYIQVRAEVCECSEGQTDTQTAMANIHFASECILATTVCCVAGEVTVGLRLRWPHVRDCMMYPGTGSVALLREIGISAVLL